MITITAETDDEERALRAAFQDRRLSRAIRPRFAIKRDGHDVGGMEAPLIEGGPRETYLSAGRPSGTITIMARVLAPSRVAAFRVPPLYTIASGF